MKKNGVKDTHKGFSMTLAKGAMRRKKEILSCEAGAVSVGDNTSVADIVDDFADSSVQARNINGCAAVFRDMLLDRERPTILLGLAGPLIAAGLREVIRSMIDLNMVDVVVSTGAIMYQDIYQARGFRHYIGDPRADDGELRRLYIDRIYDTYVDEQRFWDTDCWIGRFADTLEPRDYSTREFMAEIAGEIDDKNSIVKTAAEKGIPVFVPAINDSSIGIGLTEYYHRAKVDGKKPITISAIRDNYEIAQIVNMSKKTAAIYIAGGVPKNYINDSVIMSYIFGRETGGHAYAFQLTTDVPHWGGLSGSTLKEATSWGKINVKARYAMAFIEPSVSLPLVYGYVRQRGYYKGRPRKKFVWQDDVLVSLK